MFPSFSNTPSSLGRCSLQTQAKVPRGSLVIFSQIWQLMSINLYILTFWRHAEINNLLSLVLTALSKHACRQRHAHFQLRKCFVRFILIHQHPPGNIKLSLPDDITSRCFHSEFNTAWDTTFQILFYCSTHKDDCFFSVTKQASQDCKQYAACTDCGLLFQPGIFISFNTVPA